MAKSCTLPLLEPSYKEMPSFARYCAERCTSKYRALSNLITCSGDRGIGKSFWCLYFADELSKELARITGKPKEWFFTIDNVTSIDEGGILSLLSSPSIKRENAIFICDDSGVSYGAKEHMTKKSRATGTVLQVGRIYRSTIIFNVIRQSHLDLMARQISDFGVTVLSSNVLTHQSVARITRTKAPLWGKEDLHPFLTWQGRRVKFWLGSAPPEDLIAQYQRLRQEQTDAHIDRVHEEHLKKIEGPTRKRPRDQAKELCMAIRKMHDEEGVSVRALSRRFHVTKYVVERALMEADAA